MAKVLHAADFHLDSAFRALPEEQARLRRQESRELPGRLVDWANDHGARLMLLAGDLFDSDQLYSQTAQMLAQALSRFRGTVVIAPGNHDWLSAASPYRQPIWPGNVHIFLGRGIERLALPELQCTVYGAAFTAPEEPESGLRGFYAQPDGSARIMVLHGDMGSRESRYRPLTPEEIAATGLDYLALGHVHAPSAMNRAGNTVWAYPGCPQGREEDLTPHMARIEDRMEVAMPTFLLGFKCPPVPEGEERMRLDILGDLACDVLMGESSPLFTRLYSQGLINGTFDSAYDLLPGAAYVFCGGDSNDPEAVQQAVLDEARRVVREGVDPAYVQRIRRASFGASIKSLNSFEAIASTAAEGCFQGYDPFRFPEVYDSITQQDLLDFIRDNIRPERMALSIIYPKE